MRPEGSAGPCFGVTSVFVAGQGYPYFRIPSVIATEAGTVVAFAEGRAALGDHSRNHIVCRRSPDGGRTWSDVRVVAADGRNCLNNPCVVQARGSGRLLLMYQRYPEGFHEKEVDPGLHGSRVLRSFVTSSSDDGASWSEPVDIAAEIKRPDVTTLCSGPGIGIQLSGGSHSGRIVMPFNQGPWNQWKCFAVWSDDDGKAWSAGEPAPDSASGNGNEVQMVEVGDGRLMLNARPYGATRNRMVATSVDGGQTWTPTVEEPALPDPACMGSIIRYAHGHGGSRSRIIFANCATQSTRTHGTIRVSYDEGKSWSAGKTIDERSFAYCCLTLLPGGDVGCLYETDQYNRIALARMSLDWLTDGKDYA